MKNADMLKHVTGESIFIDDYPIIEGTLTGLIFYSASAHALIEEFDISDALEIDGIEGIFTYKDIPGENQIGGIIKDEPLFAESEVHYIGQPIAIIVAQSREIALTARNRIKIKYRELEVITGAREAFGKGRFISTPRIITSGDVEKGFSLCDFIITGSVESGAQEHLYMETQGAYVYECEGQIKIISSTQNPSAIQRIAARVLDISTNKVEVDVLRLGGGFGGKEDQATPYAAMCAVAASKLKRPVKLILSRAEDILITGKRHPYSSDYKIGLNKAGEILCFESVYYQNAGAAADLSTAILDRTLFHAANSYNIPNIKITGYSCRTNLPPNTAFRGFGGPQAMFVIESAIYKAAEVMKKPAHELQEKNLLKDGDSFYFGQPVNNCTAHRCWQKLKDEINFDKIESNINLFNSQNKFIKKGFALMPICFGISFTNTALNQAGALVHIYADGSVNISSAAVEMGQGVNMKLRQVAQKLFSIDIDKIKIDSTNTSRIANSSPTAASSGADLNGKAVESACNILLERLKKAASEYFGIGEKSVITAIDEMIYVDGIKSEISWSELVRTAYKNRVSLSAHAHFATPGLNKNNPFAYHVYGSALIAVTLDCLRGTYEIDSVNVVHDFGKSLNPAIDRSQAEGAIMQGIGWMTMEEIIHDLSGNLKSNSLSTYKVPDVYFTPKMMDVQFLDDSTNSGGIFNSKAIGEPPFMYGIGVYYALMNAIKAFNNSEYKISAPLTHEKILLNLYSQA